MHLPMSSHSAQETEDLLAEAAMRARSYQWLSAAGLYKQTLERLGLDKDPSETGRLTELLARSYFKGAFQAETREEFKRGMKLAKECYETSSTIYRATGDEALSKRSRARGLFTAFWLLEKATDRRDVITECIALSRDACRIFDDQKEIKRLGESRADLLSYFFESLMLAPDWETLKEQYEAGVEISEETIKDSEGLVRNESFVEALHFAIGLLSNFALFVFGPEEYQGLAERRRMLGKKLNEASEAIGTSEALSLAKESAAYILISEGSFADELKLCEAGLSKANETKDSYLIGRLLLFAHLGVAWQENLAEEAAQARELLEKGLEFAPMAIKRFEISMHGPLLDTAYSFYGEAYISLATDVETDREKKIGYLEKAVEVARKGVSYKDCVTSADSEHTLSKALYYLASLVKDPGKKRLLLNEALPAREEYIRAQDSLYPNSWNRGMARNYLALTKAELSKLEPDLQTKTNLLRDGISSLRECLELCRKWATNSAFVRALAWYEEFYGDILVELHSLTRKNEEADEAVRAYQSAASHLRKEGLIGPAATMEWKIARVHDTLGRHELALAAFKKAAEDYHDTSTRNSGSAQAFAELSSYMMAWTIIEQARLNHCEEQYLRAAENFDKAAGILQQTTLWSHLSKHYTACSLLEKGEAFSRQEDQTSSISALTLAEKAFQEADKELESKLAQDIGPKEERELKNWLGVTRAHEKYCLARIEVEEAKLLDMKGDEEASVSKYRSASKVFRTIQANPLHPEHSQNELETLALFCDAWGMMKRAELTASPELYSEAAESFRKASRAVAKGQTRLLAMAGASICEALRSGVQFRLTQDTELYSQIKKQLEAASSFYESGAFDNASIWTRATERLFDAFVYMADAEIQREVKKKTESYHLAEKHLELSAKLYGEAGFHKKREEALKHLRRAREQKELLLTPVEALTENPSFSRLPVTTAYLAREQALGLEKFEAANVVGNLTVSELEVSAGSNFTLDLEVTNVGKTAARLLKLENVAPAGIEIDSGRIPHKLEGKSIDLKGRKLEYFKTNQLKISLKAARKGSFNLCPRILYADDGGTHHSFEFEPAVLTVNELGISGWLRGPK